MSTTGNRLTLDLSQTLFWDVDPKHIDLEKHKRFVITRTFERGSEEAMKAVLAHYGRKVCEKELRAARYLSPVTLSFCCCILHLEKEDFRSHHLRQSMPQFDPWW